jgi:hypothetical protein
MQAKLNLQSLAVFLLVILASSLYSCKSTFLVQPPINSKIYSETTLGGTQYYCYFNFTNFANSFCNVSFEKPLNHLKLISPIPITLAGSTTTEVKFEIVDFDQNAVCPPQCEIEEILLKGVWNQYNDPNYFVEQKPVVQWSTPIVQVNCWVPTDPPGDVGNFYKAPLCNYITPDIGGTGGMQYNWKKIGDIYNPNNFDIKVLVNHQSDPSNPCYRTDNAGPSFLIWQDLPAHTTFNYGDIIRTNFKTPIYCLRDNPDAYIYIWQPTGTYTVNNNGSKWIALKVTLLP